MRGSGLVKPSSLRLISTEWNLSDRQMDRTIFSTWYYCESVLQIRSQTFCATALPGESRDISRAPIPLHLLLRAYWAKRLSSRWFAGATENRIQTFNTRSNLASTFDQTSRRLSEPLWPRRSGGCRGFSLHASSGDPSAMPCQWSITAPGVILGIAFLLLSSLNKRYLCGCTVACTEAPWCRVYRCD